MYLQNMKKLFETNKIEEEYYDEKHIQKKYGLLFQKGLEKLLSAIDAAECAYDIKCLPQFKMHMLKYDLRGIYSLSPDNKKSKWRVPAICLDENDKERKPSADLEEIKLLKETKKFKLGKIGDYHD